MPEYTAAQYNNTMILVAPLELLLLFQFMWLMLKGLYVSSGVHKCIPLWNIMYRFSLCAME